MLLSIVVVVVGLEARVVVMGHPARVVGGSKEGVATVVLGVVGHGGRISKGRVVVTEARHWWGRRTRSLDIIRQEIRARTLVVGHGGGRFVW